MNPSIWKLKFVVLFFLHLALQAENFIVFLVEAPHLQYESVSGLLKSVAKHPSNYSKNGDVGHAWIYLHGYLDGKEIVCEGGHSGELGVIQPTYFKGVYDNILLGSKNPISYLFCAQEDGFFQRGNGNHVPTYAAKMRLTEQQLRMVIDFIHQYDFKKYSLTERQCCTLINEIASQLGLTLKTKRLVYFPQEALIGKNKVCLWTDPKYSKICFSCPDLLELALKKAVEEGQLEPAKQWSDAYYRPSLQKLLQQGLLLPMRLARYLSF
ncbi:MAG: hypothetical protein ACSNEK_02550 [Parachlamydiaceae bacterium]